jgi:Predicted transcriptional regulators
MFGENLQNLRKIKSMSQEQLAEKLDVSRQAVSKWESGGGYPEIDKIISICEIFNCNMDILMKGKISEDTTGDKKRYDIFENTFSKGIAFGVGLILIGVTLFLFISGLVQSNAIDSDKFDAIAVAVLLCFVVISVPIFIFLGIRKADFKKKYPKLPNFYTEEEIDEFNKKFPVAISIGVVLIIFGVILLILLPGIGVVTEESNIPVTILMALVTVAVTIFTYYGNQKVKYDIDAYNLENSSIATPEDIIVNEKIGRMSGVIMLTATAIYLFISFVFNCWEISWIVFPIGGIMCAIVEVFHGKD